jgi:hypothetical protein
MDNKLVQDLSRQVPNWNVNGVFLGPYHKSLEQFAELIVRECAGVVSKDMDYHANWCGDKILKHFGIEE